MLIYNEDWIHFIWTRYEAGIEITEENLKEYIYSFKGSQVTDFAINVNGTISTADSKVLETFADKYMATEENGIPVDYKNTFAKNAYKLITEKKIDMYKVWIDTLNEIGINPWISIRMNDCHGNFEETNIRKSSYVEQKSDCHLASHRERIGYFDRCYDYAKPEIRKMMLDYIDEMLGRYDVYGLELDMMRDMFFFRFGQESVGAPIMKQFMEDVNSVKAKYEEKYGHDIKLSVLLSPSPNLVIERGIDIFDFIDMLDMIVIIGRWETTDTDMPIELWKQLLRGTNVKLACGQQLLYAPYRGYKPTVSSVKMAFGQAIANLSRGSDAVYLYNYMDYGEFEGEISDWIYESGIRNDANRPLMFNNMGKVETLLKQERSHVVTYADFSTYDISANSRLPIEFHEHSEYQQIKIPVGKIPEGAKVNLILGIKNEDEIKPEDISVYVNSVTAPFAKQTKITPIYEHDCYVFDVADEYLEIMYAEVKINKKCRLEHAEIEVLP